ncbi:MAG: right-handed parallel beta-helix repeat-containing protein [bacterium]
MVPPGEHPYANAPEKGVLLPAPRRLSSTNVQTYLLPFAVEYANASNCTLNLCRIEHSGCSGVGLLERCSSIRITQCEISDIGGNGVMIGAKTNMVHHYDYWEDLTMRPSGNVVSNNYVHHCGMINYDCGGIWVARSVNSIVTHNTVKSIPAHGITCGWDWGPSYSEQTNCLIANNYVYDVARRFNDSGGIYTHGSQPGTIIRDNVVRDLYMNPGYTNIAIVSIGPNMPGAIYLDDGTRNIRVESNIIYGVSDVVWENFQTSYAAANIVWTNNTTTIEWGDPAFPRNRELLAGATDSDGDELFDWAETNWLGTSATSSDTDGDGCNDGWEVRAGTDPASTGSKPKRVLYDFDGDGRADHWAYGYATKGGTYTAWWTIVRSSDGLVWAPQYGYTPGLVPMPRDYDGDYKTDLCVIDTNSEFYWYIHSSSTGGVSTHLWGNSGFLPVPADYDADGKADVGAYNLSIGYWSIMRSTLGYLSNDFGHNSGGTPVPADYDGDGTNDLAIYNKDMDGSWFIQRSQAGYVSNNFGWGGAYPVPGDYDGDGKADQAVRQTGLSGYDGQSLWSFKGITNGDRHNVYAPDNTSMYASLVADYDGDGKCDYAVVSNSTGWLIFTSQDGEQRRKIDLSWTNSL